MKRCGVCRFDRCICGWKIARETVISRARSERIRESALSNASVGREASVAMAHRMERS